MKPKILVIDDERNIREIFSLLLKEKGYEVDAAESGMAGLEKARKIDPEVVLLDMHLPDIPGLDLLARIKASRPEAEIIIITAYGTIRSAVEATKIGAYAYLEKPVDNEELLLTVSRILELKELQREVKTLKSELTSRYRFSSIVGTSGRMNSVFQLMEKMCAVEGTVLITGESGTGKELAARAIHFNSLRKDGPFVVVNCGAVPKDLIESEFFGHVKGAFTDAKTEKTGKFEMAHRGTIFLDEVGELSQDAQVKLLRALGEREIIRVGGTKTIPVDVRVIAATNKKLEEQVERNNFREDLYYRLAVLSLHLAPLRDRSEDIPLLCEHFMRKYSAELDKDMMGISRRALDVLASYSWPGNVRELENVVYEAMVMAEGGWLDAGDLPSRIKMSESGGGKKDENVRSGQSLRAAAKGAAEEAERELIRRAMCEAGGNRTRAAAILGVSRKTLFNKMAALDIKWPE